VVAVDSRWMVGGYLFSGNYGFNKPLGKLALIPLIAAPAQCRHNP